MQWGTIGADYSTHSAVALVLCMLVSIIARQSLIAAAVIFISYVALMLYQQYHTIHDVLTTVIVIGVVYAVMLKLLKPRRPVTSASW